MDSRASLPRLGLLSLVLAGCGGGGDGKGDELGETSAVTLGSTSESGTETSSTGSDSTSSESTASTDSSTDSTGTDSTGSTDSSGTDSTSSDSSSDSSGTDSTTSDTNMACQEFNTIASPIPPDVMFLLDRSGSMLEIGFDLQNPNKTRWQALYEAVEAVVGNGADAQIAFGAKTFSTQGFGACGVSPQPDVPIALNNAANLLATIPGPMAQVNGGTPTNLGLEMTMDYMKAYQGIGGAKFIILITDGGIMCTNDAAQALVDAVAVLEDGFMNFDITTYVVAIAASNFGNPSPVVQLDTMAVAGGAPKMGIGGEDFYRADDAQQLAAALIEVVENSYLTSCLINLDEPPFFPDFTKVVVGGQSFDLVADCESEDGFVYTNAEFSQIKLCGQACTLLGIDGMADVQYYCDPG